MGYQLHRELAEALGPEISGLERLVALQIALDALDPGVKGKPGDNRKPRESRIRLEKLARWTGAKNEDVVRRILKRLAAEGWEFRVPIGKGKDGRILYAVPGVALNFRVPEAPQGGTTVPPSPPETFSQGGTTVREGGTTVPSEGTTVTPYVLPTTDELLPSRAMSSLSSQPTRASAQREDSLITWATREYQASADEIEAAWEYAQENGMQSKRAWLKSCGDDVAEQIRETRRHTAAVAAYEARTPLPECEDCGRPMRGDGGPLCTDCR